MLTLLEIENIAVIKKASMETESGFNVLTGETGGGKSLLIDSLSLVLGSRGQRELISAGADYAMVRASFFCPSLSGFLEENGLTPEDDGTVILFRKLYRDGRNLCRYGSETIPLSLLKAIGGRLVSIHGQHDSISLLSPSSHLDFIDGYCRSENLIKDYKEKFRAYKTARHELEEARAGAGQRQAGIEHLTAVIEEIADACLKDGEEEELTSRRKILSSSEELMSLSSRGESSSAEAVDYLDSAASAAEEISELDESMKGTAERLREIYYELQEIHRDLSSYASKIEYNPDELSETEARLGLIYRLEGKYGFSVKDVLTYLEKANAELCELTYFRDNGGEMEANVRELKSQAERIAEKITALRKEKGGELCEKICGELAFLDMPKTKISLKLTPCELWEKGAEKAELLISVGDEEPKPLGKIASGGELSRIMLAMKSVFSESDDVSTVVFDEIDSGVSGRAAEKIGRKLKELSRRQQVLCVTHLPVIAAAANHHLLIEKDPDTLTTTVRPIEGEERAAEIARIMCGDSVTEAAMQNARELLGKEETR